MGVRKKRKRQDGRGVERKEEYKRIGFFFFLSAR